MKGLEILVLTCLVAGATAQVWCTNPPGDIAIPTSDCCGAEKVGLGNFTRHYFELMELGCMLDIFFDAIMWDAEVLDFYNYISGPEFEKLCLYIQEAPEFQALTEYMCFELHFDPYQYLNTMGSILNIRHMPHPEGCIFESPLPWLLKNMGPTISKKAENPDRPRRWPVDQNTGIGGVVGLIDVLYYEIPHDQGYDLWLYHVETDEYLCRAVEKMRGPEFRYLVRRVENLPYYLDFVYQMESYGVNWTGFTDELKKFIFESDYCL